MDPILQYLMSLGLKPDAAQRVSQNLVPRTGPVIMSIPDPVVTPLDPRGEYAKLFGAQAPGTATDMQVAQAVEAENTRRSFRGPDGPPTHPVITEPNVPHPPSQVHKAVDAGADALIRTVSSAKSQYGGQSTDAEIGRRAQAHRALYPQATSKSGKQVTDAEVKRRTGKQTTDDETERLMDVFQSTNQQSD